MTLIKNAEVFYKGEFRSLDIRFDDRIEELGRDLGADKAMDCSGKLIVPGGIDPHVHFRDFNELEKEDWHTGSRAAVAGGTTAVLDMPNNDPPVTNKEMAEMKKEKIAESCVNGHIYGGISEGNLGRLEGLAADLKAFKLYMGQTTGSLAMPEQALQRKCMEALGRTDCVLTVHAENPGLFRDSTDHADSRPPEAEQKAIRRAVEMTDEFGLSLHIAHVSSEKGLDVIRHAKSEGSDITAEVCTHHLLFTKRDVKDGFLKVNPPLRTEKERQALWKGLRDGTIDMVSSDHAPHTMEEKEQSLKDAPSGVPGVQERYPFMLSRAFEGDIPVEKVIQACCRAPAERFGLRGRGRIEEGAHADLFVFERENTGWSDEMVESKCGWSPYQGMNLSVFPSRTFLEGDEVFRRGHG